MKFIMNFLRSPFQFRSTDQSSKKSDSASPIVENMFIDPTTGISTDPKWRATSPGIGASSSVPGSPRLQHRVPGFENNGSRPIEVIHEPTTPQNSPNEECEKPQRVRVVPIKVESVDDSSSPKRRPGAFHSSSGTIPRSGQFGPLHPNFEELQNRKRHSSGPASHKKSEPTESKPKVCNIPIFVEGRDTPVVPKTSPSSQNVPVRNVTPEVKQNGGNLAKCSAKTKQNNCVSLKQISDILSELQGLKAGVDVFKGVPHDKEYRYLDEMLTRCMLKLDNVETYGDDEVRASRKAAVKAVEKCITDLESLAQANAKSKQPAGEECNPSDLDDTTKEEEIVSEEQTGLSMSEDHKKTDETVTRERDSASSAVPSDQAATKESNDPLCTEGSNSTESKPQLAETAQVVAENIECMDVTASHNSEDITNKPTDINENTTKKSEEPGERMDNQPANSVENTKAPDTLAEVNGEPMEIEVTDVPSQLVDLSKQNEPMDLDKVPEAKVKLDSEDQTTDSEMLKLIKEQDSCENENSSVSTKVSN